CATHSGYTPFDYW
nr:immunoglobulin heavy chain junction region [Macaca mulatta]